jgi:hypothetical protein
MAKLSLNGFSGLLPRVPESKLPLGGALAAENIDFSGGQLQSLKGDFALRQLPHAARSVFSENGLQFYTWTEDVNAVPSPLQAGDASDLLYYTTPTDFRVTRLSLATESGGVPATSWRVGVPKPTRAPIVTVVHPALPAKPVATVDPEPVDTYATRLASAQAAAEATQTAGTKTSTETRVYTYTYRNVFNEEGPPSPSATVDVKAVTLNGVTTYSKVTVQVPFDELPDYVAIKSAGLYRTADGATAAEFYYAMTVPVAPGQATVEDAVKGAALNEPLSSNFFYPPDPLLQGLIHLGNGILAAWKGKQLWLSEAYKPWAWNPANMQTFAHPIVGAIRYGSGALVTTVGEPVIVSGLSPDGMAQVSLEVPQAGVSKWSLLALDGLAVYASHDGLIVLNGGQQDMRVTKRYFTRKVWRKRYAAGLASMQFAYYDGRLIVFSRANAFVPFMLELDEAGAMTELPGLRAQAATVLVTSDQLYTVDGTTLNQFAGGADLPLHWASDKLVLPSPVMLAVAKAECEGNFTIRFYQDGVLGFTQAVSTGATVFRLPSQPIPGHAGLACSDRWEIDIAGTGTFKRLKAASSTQELKES